MINNKLFADHLTREGYHVHGGLLNELCNQGLSFACGCGLHHRVDDAYIIREQRREGTLIFCCSTNDRLLTIVKRKGFLKTKRLDTIASLLTDVDEVYQQFFAFNQMTKKGMNSLGEYYAEQRSGIY